MATAVQAGGKRIVTECEACEPPDVPARPPRKGNKVTLIAVRDMPFGRGRVIDPEVRVPRPPGGSTGRTTTVRCARLRCECGQVYLASLSSLFSGQRKSCGCAARKGGPGLKQVYVQANKGGYAVVAYLGWVKTREEAEDIARRTRVVVIPESPITGV
jgi:hypothetical protein